MILRRAKQPFGQIDITLRNLEAERGIVVHRRSTTKAVQKKNKKLNSPDRKYFILQQTCDLRSVHSGSKKFLTDAIVYFKYSLIINDAVLLLDHHCSILNCGGKTG